MTQLAFQSDPRRWRNEIPQWIRLDDAERPQRKRLKAGHWSTLQAIADKCDAPDRAGSLVGAFGGQGLVDQAGVSLASFWRHLRRLESLGYVVTIGRGGTIGRRNYGNTYGIPGSPGALDHRRAQRRMQQMVEGDDGRHRPNIIEPGDQVKLFPERSSSGGPAAPAASSPSSSCPSPPGPSRSAEKVTRGSCQSDTGGRVKVTHHHSPSGSPLFKNHGAVASGGDGARRARPSIGHVTPEDLTGMRKLLALFDRAVDRGLVEGSEDGRLRFVAAAEHALRCADRNAAGLFASIVNNGRWLYITHADEEAAAAKLRNLHAGPRSSHVAPQRPQRKQASQLSDDARMVLAAQQLATKLNRDAFRVLQAQQGWTRDRYDAAQRELEGGG